MFALGKWFWIRMSKADKAIVQLSIESSMEKSDHSEDD